MMRETRVWQLMSRPVKVVPENAGIREAAQALHEFGISGAPVVDDRGSIVGVLSLRDVAACVASRLLKLPALFPTLDGADEPADGVAACPAFEDLEGARVADFMTRGVRFVDPDAHVRNAVRLMRRHAIHRVFVRRGNGPVAGVITTSDVLRWAEDPPEGRPSPRAKTGNARTRP